VRDGFYRQTARVEAAHWWFVHRRRLVSALLRGRTELEAGGRVLDVGCGSGGNLDWLHRSGFRAVGLDVSPLALALARGSSPSAVLTRARAQDLSGLFLPGSFDLVTVFNVLYHAWIPDETEVLRAARRVLAPGGYLLLTEPAFGFLRRRHDEIDHGVRRYTRSSIEGMVRTAGFEVVVSSYFNLLAFAPALLAAGFDRLRRRSGLGAREAGEETSEVALPPTALNRALIALCGVERSWIERHGRLPFGVGVLVLARASAHGRRERGQVGT